MPTMPIAIGSGPKKTFGLINFLDAPEREKYNVEWNKFLSSSTTVLERKKPWRKFKCRRRIKREMKREIRKSSVNCIELDTEDEFLKNRKMRRIKNMLGHTLSKKINIL